MYQFLSVLHGLQVLLLPFVGLILLLQVGLDGLVLGVEVTHVLQRQSWHTRQMGTLFKHGFSKSIEEKLRMFKCENNASETFAWLTQCQEYMYLY